MGVGFTTSESELVVNNPVRRKILTLLIFFGNAGVITTISSVIFSFLSLERSDSFLVEGLVLFGGLLLLLGLSQSKWVNKKLSALIDRALTRYTNLDVRDYYRLLHLADDYQVSEIRVEENAWMANKSLEEMKLDAEGISVLGIKRGKEKYLGAPDGNTEIERGDVVILYGRSDLLENLEKRKEGGSGDSEHFLAVNDQEEKKKKEENES